MSTRLLCLILVLYSEVRGAEPLLYCPHNGRDGVSASDCVQHALNQDYGDLYRDIVDVCNGDVEFVGLNQPPTNEEKQKN